MGKTAQDDNSNTNSEFFGTLPDKGKTADENAATSAITAKRSHRATEKRKTFVSSEFRRDLRPLRADHDASRRLEGKPEPSFSTSLSGMEKIVDEVLESRQGMADCQKKKADLLNSSKHTGISRQFGKVELFSRECEGSAESPISDTAASRSAHIQKIPGREAVATTDSGVNPAPPDDAVKPVQGEGDQSSTPLPEFFSGILNSPELLHIPDRLLPTMLWTPETHRAIFKCSEELAKFTESAAGAACDHNAQVFSRTSATRESDGMSVSSEAVPSPEKSDGVSLSPHVVELLERSAGEPVANRSSETPDNMPVPGAAFSRTSSVRETIAGPAALDTGDQVRFPTSEEPVVAGNSGLGDYEIKAADQRTSQTDLAGDERDLPSDYYHGDILSSGRPKLRPTLERPGNLAEISAEIQDRFIKNISEASQHYSRLDFEQGDAAVGRAISTVALSAGMEPGAVAIRPLILASAGQIAFSQDQGSSGADADEEKVRYSQLVELGIERQPSAMAPDQLAYLSTLAERAAISAADRLLSGEGMYLVKTDATERLATDLEQVVRGAAESRLNGIGRADIELIANNTAREGCTEPLTRLITAGLNSAIENVAQQTLQSAMREDDARPHPALDTSTPAAPPSAVMPVGEQEFAGRPSQVDKLAGDGLTATHFDFSVPNEAQATSSRPDFFHPESTDKLGFPEEMPQDSARTASTGDAVSDCSTVASNSKDHDRLDGQVDRGWEGVIPLPLGLGVRSVSVPHRMTAGFPAQAQTFTLKMLTRSASGCSRIAELLLNALTHRGALRRLTESLKAFKSGNFDVRNGGMTIKLDGFGKGETAFVVFAGDEREAAFLQEQLQSLLASPKSLHKVGDGRQRVPPL